MSRFDGKVVLITGAANGIGLAAATEFALEGAIVVATDLDAAALEIARTTIGEHGSVETHVHDVTDENRWRAVVDDVVARHGHLDVVVNNAGIGAFEDIEQTTLDGWRRILAVNLDGVFIGTKVAIEAMRENGGVVVNLASVESEVGDPLLPAYNASKGGVKMLTKSAALHCARAGYPIRVVSLHPGFCSTPMVANGLATLESDAAAAVTQGIVGKIAFGRLATPREIARPLLFLASEDASYITGSGLVVDGGFTAA